MLIVLGLAVVLGSANFWVNRYLKPRWLRSFAADHPGYTLRVGRLEYQLFRNLTVCRDLSLTSSNASWSCEVQKLAVTGVPWINVVFAKRQALRNLTQTVVHAEQSSFKFPGSQYQLRCRVLRGSLPAREIVAEDIELRPQGSDEQFFAGSEYRRARFHLRAPRLTMSGFKGKAMLAGKGWETESVQLKKPALEVLIDRSKPRNPHPRPAIMPNEAFAKLSEELHIGAVEVDAGRITLTETLGSSEAPGVMTFDAIELSAKPSANNTTNPAPFLLTGEALLMNSGLLKGTMELPLSGPDLSFHYSASLGAMDLRTLNSFLHVVGRSRIDSGSVQSASCNVVVSAGHATGRFEGFYRDLAITVLDRATGEDEGVASWLKTAFVNHVALRASNPDVKSGKVKVGAIDHTRTPEEKFLPFVWRAIRSGMFDILGLNPYVKAPH